MKKGVLRISPFLQNTSGRLLLKNIFKFLFRLSRIRCGSYTIASLYFQNHRLIAQPKQLFNVERFANKEVTVREEFNTFR